MANGKRTRFALARSMLCAALCLALLVGTTFAWFSDEAKTGQTTITAGNLDVELQVEQEDGTFEEVTPDTKLFPEDVVWEPGMMRESGVFKVVNAGSLALQYELFLEIKPADGSEGPDLGKVIKLKVLSKEEYDKHSAELGEDATLQARRDLWNAIGGEGVTNYSKGKLLPKDGTPADGDAEEGFTDDETPGLIVVLFWDPSDSAELDNPDNEYNAKDGAAALSAAFSLDVFATQVPYESDSFGKRYDNIYVAGNDRELLEAVEKAGEGDLIDVLPGSYDADDFADLQPGVDVRGKRGDDDSFETVIDVADKGVSSSGGTLSDLKFEKVDPKDPENTIPPQVKLSDGAAVENCEFADTRSTGGSLKNVTVDGSATIRGCKFLSGNGIYSTGKGITGELLVENCVFGADVDVTLSLTDGNANGHVTLRGCDFQQSENTSPIMIGAGPAQAQKIGNGVLMESCTVNRGISAYTNWTTTGNTFEYDSYVDFLNPGLKFVSSNDTFKSKYIQDSYKGTYRLFGGKYASGEGGAEITINGKEPDPKWVEQPAA